MLSLSFLRRSLLLRRNIPSQIHIMSRHLYLDISPPQYTGPRDKLDKSFFKKTLPVLAARLRPEKVGSFLKSPALKKCGLQHPLHSLANLSATGAVSSLTFRRFGPSCPTQMALVVYYSCE